MSCALVLGVERKIATGKPDYWDYATRLELAVLARDEKLASFALGDTLAVRERWEPETTADNLKLIREARERQYTGEPWLNSNKGTKCEIGRRPLKRASESYPPIHLEDSIPIESDPVQRVSPILFSRAAPD